jgi:hypothetical protein
MTAWQPIQVDLSAYVGNVDPDRFSFDSNGTHLFNDVNEGWHIDEVRITAQFPANESTALVRIQEAAVIGFTSGGIVHPSLGTPVALKNGDVIRGQTSGASAIVFGNPLVASGAWTGTATGILKMQNVRGTFQNGEILLATVTGVIGDQDLATVDTSIQPYDDRENLIQAYVADAVGAGTPDGDPLDLERLALPRGTVQWPAFDPNDASQNTATTDYFTLTRWDQVNSASTASLVPFPTTDNRHRTMIQSGTHVTTGVTLAQPELGLHTFGRNSTSVFFDDFAIQAVVSSTGNQFFGQVIQE